MITSLRVRLLVTFICVVTIALGTVALFASRITQVEFNRYIIRDMERDHDIGMLLDSYYQQDASDQDVDQLALQMEVVEGRRVVLIDMEGVILADTENQLLGQYVDQTGELPDAQIITLVDQQYAPLPYDVVVEPSDPYIDLLPTNPLSMTPEYVQQPDTNNILTFPITDTYTTVASIHAVPDEHTISGLFFTSLTTEDWLLESDPIATSFVSGVNQSIVLAVIVAGFATLLLTWMLSRRILHPVEALTAAARQMETGDLSQRVRVNARDEIGTLAHAFNQMADGLERLEQLRHNMVTDVAHELRSPLTNIRGYLEAMRDGVTEPHPRLIDSLYDEAMLLNRLIDDLQDLALAEAGQLPLVRQTVQPHTLIEQAAQSVQPAAQRVGLTITCDLPPSLPCINADTERIGQVLRNLLHNAIAYTLPEGHITITARTNNGMVEIGIQDSGVGIAPKHAPFIFERFYRVDPSRTRATGGAGLGLAIVKQLITAHGGMIWVDSIVGVGSTFTLTLPIVTSDA